MRSVTRMAAAVGVAAIVAVAGASVAGAAPSSPAGRTGWYYGSGYGSDPFSAQQQALYNADSQAYAAGFPVGSCTGNPTPATKSGSLWFSSVYVSCYKS